MYRIRFHVLREVFADSALVGIGRISGAHEIAIFLNGVFALEDLYDNWARRHERDQVIEEGSLLVNGVKAFRLFHRQVQAFLGDYPEPRILEPGIDFASEIATGGIRFYN